MREEPYLIPIVNYCNQHRHYMYTYYQYTHPNFTLAFSLLAATLSSADNFANSLDPDQDLQKEANKLRGPRSPESLT